MVASSPSFSALVSFLPVLPCELLEQWGRQEGENGILLPFLKWVHWAATISPHLDTPANATTAFVFFLDSDLSQGILYWTLWESDLHKKTVWLGFSEGAEHPQSWQTLGSAFAQKTAAASHSGCLVVKKEKEDAGDRLSDSGTAGLPALLKVLAFDLFSLRLRKCWKSSFKNVHLE